MLKVKYEDFDNKKISKTNNSSAEYKKFSAKTREINGDAYQPY